MSEKEKEKENKITIKEYGYTITYGFSKILLIVCCEFCGVKILSIGDLNGINDILLDFNHNRDCKNQYDICCLKSTFIKEFLPYLLPSIQKKIVLRKINNNECCNIC